MAEDGKQVQSVMRSLERALQVLRVLEVSTTPLRLSDIAKAAELHVATTQRLINVLLRYEYIRQDGYGYAMGIASLLNAHAFIVSNPLILAATPVLQELADSTGHTASLSMRSGFFQVILVRIEGSSPLRYQLPIGEKLPRKGALLSYPWVRSGRGVLVCGRRGRASRVRSGRRGI